jgi:hypothetical protein
LIRRAVDQSRILCLIKPGDDGIVCHELSQPFLRAFRVFDLQPVIQCKILFDALRASRGGSWLPSTWNVVAEFAGKAWGACR